MFNGIVEKIAKVTEIHPMDSHNQKMVISIQSKLDRTVKLGDSIALNGVCLTVEKILSQKSFAFTLGKETLDITTLKNLKIGNWLNLETAVRLDDSINGHLITGHIDAIGKIETIIAQGESYLIKVSYPKKLADLIAKKGSIALDGVSLTINQLVDDIKNNHYLFELNIIPFTYDNTLFSQYKIGDEVNLEIDLLSRYIQRQFQFTNQKKYV